MKEKQCFLCWALESTQPSFLCILNSAHAEFFSVNSCWISARIYNFSCKFTFTTVQTNPTTRPSKNNSHKGIKLVVERCTLKLPQLHRRVTLLHQTALKSIDRRQTTNAHSRSRFKLEDDRLTNTVLQTWSLGRRLKTLIFSCYFTHAYDETEA